MKVWINLSTFVSHEFGILLDVEFSQDAVIVVEFLRIQLVRGFYILKLLLQGLDIRLQLNIQTRVLICSPGSKILKFFYIRLVSFLLHLSIANLVILAEIKESIDICLEVFNELVSLIAEGNLKKNFSFKAPLTYYTLYSTQHVIKA